MIQSRGQFNNPKDFFPLKLWNDYKLGFGTPGKNQVNLQTKHFLWKFHRVQATHLTKPSQVLKRELLLCVRGRILDGT